LTKSFRKNRVTPLYFRDLRIGVHAPNIAKLAKTAPQVFREMRERLQLVAQSGEAASVELNALLKV
jgi:hypothetical protein